MLEDKIIAKEIETQIVPEEGEFIWRSKDGDIPLSKMEDKHVIRAAMFMKGQAIYWHKRGLKCADIFLKLEEELIKRRVDMEAEGIPTTDEEEKKYKILKTNL